ncbi:MAG: S9 family peptidase [Acidobacteriales bacterium]|nr:S9 family peptidase [Terriglobales bacterium]
MKCMLLLCTLTASIAAAAQQTFTLDQIMSAPFSEQLVRARHAPRVAWVTNVRGVRNVYVADAPKYRARQVTHYSEDDGQPIAALAISGDGKTLVFARGTEVAGGRSANPESLPVQPKQQAFEVHPDDANAQPVLLGDMGCKGEGCEDIQISPDDRFVVWESGHQIVIAPMTYVAPQSKDAKVPASKLTDIRGELSNPQWSPDGKRLAFRVDRKDHSLIALADLEIGNDKGLSIRALHWISPSADRDMLPQWSADGRQIAFVRTPGHQNRVPLIPPRVVPWSIYVADAQTGEAKQIWHSGATSRDSLPEFLPAGFHFAGDRITFVSEQDNWPHLYSIAVSGGNATLLTPGEFSIEDVVLSNDDKSLIYSSNQGDLDSRHIWRVPVAGGAAQQISRGETFEFHPVEVSNGDVLTLYSSAKLSAMPGSISPAHGEIAADLLVKEFPEGTLVAPKLVTFPSSGNTTIHGQLFVAPQCEHARCPALIFTHGGPVRQMLAGFSYMYYYSNAYEANQYLASRGYVVLSVNYRNGIMYGHDFQYPPNGVWRGAVEYDDVVAGAHYLESLANVDRSRMGLWGGSYGGFLTAMGLAHNSDIFKAGVDFHGVHDWSVFLPQWEEDAKNAPDLKEAIALAIKSSPVGAIEGWHSPVLLIHGDDDRNVPFSQTTDLVQRLKERHVRYEELILPDEIHDLLRWKDWSRSYQAMSDFFDRELKSSHP